MWIVICAMAHTSNYHCRSAIFRSAARSGGAVLACIPVCLESCDIGVIEFIVVENDFPFYLISFLFKIIKRGDLYNLGVYTLGTATL